MLDFKVIIDKESNEPVITTSISGKYLLSVPQLNKGTAFTLEERQAFGLLGKLPNYVESIEEQIKRVYLQYSSYESPLQQNIYLNNLHDKNQILFYKLLRTYINDMLPIIYTPTVGESVKHFSREYRQPRGLYISHTDSDHIDEILKNRSNPEIDLIVVTDGESVLGIGDQGVGGMDIPVAKLMVYSICGGIDPTRTLPIFLDVGTNNETLLRDPMYLGCRHGRISSEHYDNFIHKFVKSVQKQFPNAFLHWEDFGRQNARRLLDYYQDKLCTFNDDIQGTGAVVVSTVLAASDVTGLHLTKQRIVVFGAGSAGTGISDQLVDSMERMGLTKQEAYERFWLIDAQGLLMKDDLNLTDAQMPYARTQSDTAAWSVENISQPTFLETISQVKPTLLIGCSAQPQAFSKHIIEVMASHCKRPIILPLSNPNEKCEANPADIIDWTEGRALVATGTLFEAVPFRKQLLTIAQCNNALIFPGIGLGILAVRAKHLTKDMLWAASIALSELAPSKQDDCLPLLPSLNNAQMVARHIAIAVAQMAIETGQAQCNQDKNLKQLIDSIFWEPRYLPFKKG